MKLNSKYISSIVIIILCLGVISFLAWDMFVASKGLTNKNEADTVTPTSTAPTLTPTPAPTKTSTPNETNTNLIEEKPSLVAPEQKEKPVQNNNVVTTIEPIVKNENKPPSADVTEAELVARIKEVITKIKPYYEKDELTSAEETQFDNLSSEMDKLMELLKQKDTDGIEAEVRYDVSDYDVKILVNGSDIGVEGGTGGVLRLYNKEHYSYQIAPESELQKNWVLENGENTLSITYSRKEGDKDTSEGVVTLYLGTKELLEVILTGDDDSIKKTFKL